MNFEIGIPTLNRIDLLMPCLIMYKMDFPNTRIWLLDNGNQNIKIDGIEIIRSVRNIGVAASWNFLCHKIFENADHAVILNDDIYLGKKKAQMEEIITHKKHKGKLLTATIDWCAFVMPKSVFEQVGSFDESFFPAYYEDKDYEYRMKLMGLMPVKTPMLNPYLYKSSMTLAKEPSLLEASKANKQKYIQKWGGEPQKETYKTAKF